MKNVIIKNPITPEAISATMTKTDIIAGLFFQKLGFEEAADTGLKLGEDEDVEIVALVTVKVTD